MSVAILCDECFLGLYLGDIRGFQFDRLNSPPYGGCVCDSKDALFEHIWSHDRLLETAGGSSNPNWGRTNYL